MLFGSLDSRRFTDNLLCSDSGVLPVALEPGHDRFGLQSGF